MKVEKFKVKGGLPHDPPCDAPLLRRAQHGRVPVHDGRHPHRH